MHLIYKIWGKLLLLSVWNKINKHKINNDNFDPYNVFLAIATNIPAKTGFVVQGRIHIIYLDRIEILNKIYISAQNIFYISWFKSWTFW